MLTLRDCIDFGHFSGEDVRTLAEKEHIPDIVALEMAEDLYERHRQRRRARRTSEEEAAE